MGLPLGLHGLRLDLASTWFLVLGCQEPPIGHQLPAGQEIALVLPRLPGLETSLHQRLLLLLAEGAAAASRKLS